MVLKQIRFPSFLILILILVSACAVEDHPALRIPDSKYDQQVPTSLPTPIPERILSICLGDEPVSLFIYGDFSTSADIIPQAIYDGPVDEVNFQSSSPLLPELPSLKNELVKVTPVEVAPGDPIVDASGNRTILASGVSYRPAGCQDSSCVEVYQNQASVKMDQVEITFLIDQGIQWSDGIILTAGDSEFSFQVARQIFGSQGPRKNKFTASYQAIDEGTLLWKGLPGFRGIFSYPEYFFSPLPAHQLSDLPLEELLTSDRLNRIPMGWGPYRISEWVAGDHITLEKNPSYELNSEGLPVFDALVFRFVSGGEEALAAFYAGECQIVANEPGLSPYLPDLIEEETAGDLQLNYQEGTAWEQISFGISSLDPKRVYLQDPRTRQAIASCINREELAQLQGDVGEVINSFYLPGDPQVNGEESLMLNYDPERGNDLLEEIGWIDHDQDPDTPRLARGVESIRDDTILQLTLLTSDGEDKLLTAEKIQADLEVCGIELLIEDLVANDFLAPGPEGPVFGRGFDLALFAWAAGPYHRCQLFQTGEIPGPYPDFPKGWGGVNATGYSNPEFDALCQQLTLELPDSEGSGAAKQRLSALFEEDLPALPLYFQRDLMLSVPDLEGVSSGIFPLFWNIERFQ